MTDHPDCNQHRCRRLPGSYQAATQTTAAPLASDKLLEKKLLALDSKIQKLEVDSRFKQQQNSSQKSYITRLESQLADLEESLRLQRQLGSTTQPPMATLPNDSNPATPTERHLGVGHAAPHQCNIPQPPLTGSKYGYAGPTYADDVTDHTPGPKTSNGLCTCVYKHSFITLHCPLWLCTCTSALPGTTQL